MLAVLRLASVEQLCLFLDKHKQSPKAERTVLEVMAVQHTKDAGNLAERLLHTLDCEDPEVRNISFMALASCAPEVCGQRLLSKNWKVEEEDAFVAHYGSYAVAQASTSFDLGDVLPLIAPWRWLDAAVVRGSQSSELQLASISLVRLVLSAAGDLPELPGQVSINSPTDGELPLLSISSYENTNASVKEFFRRASEHPEDANKRMDELSNAAVACIRKIRASGNSFYLHSARLSSVRAAYLALPAEWLKLLHGAAQRTPDFVKRVRASEGIYLAFCEILLDVAPSDGAMLWKALTEVVLTRIQGTAGISDFVHMVFRAPESKEVDELLKLLSSFARTSTDLAIFELVIAAQVNRRDDWLRRLIQEDGASSLQWRKKRKAMLEAFSNYPDTQALTWPQGWKKTSLAALTSRMQKWCNRGALARLWWSKFVEAPDAPTAFAAWQVFLTCADRRAFVWMKTDMASANTNSELDRLRLLHIRLNKGELERKLAAREDKSNGLSNQLFGRDAPVRWLEMDAISS